MKFGLIVLSRILLILELILVHLFVLIAFFSFAIQKLLFLSALLAKRRFLPDDDGLLSGYFESESLNFLFEVVKFLD